MTGTWQQDPLLFGSDSTEGLVAAEWVEEDGEKDQIVLFFRRGEKTLCEKQPFEPFILADNAVVSGCPGVLRQQELSGGLDLNTVLFFAKEKAFLKAKAWLAKATGCSPGLPTAPFLILQDPVQKYLMLSGRTHFLGMRFEDLKRMQVDIECFTTPGYEFCNAEREGDRIIVLAVSDQTGWVEVLSGAVMTEKEILERFVALVRDRDPDVIEGHNLFNFDLPYIATRAKRHGVKLQLGRDGSEPKRRPSRMNVGDRTLSYERFDIFGRHVVDTLFLVHAYDVSHRSLDGYGLKEVAAHFGFARRGRVYIEGSEIARVFQKDPDRVMEYIRDDVQETRDVSGLLSRSSFIQAQMFPYSYQNVCVRGNATKIDALMIREYLRQGHSIPRPAAPRNFEGGYTDIFMQGVVSNVHHADVRSLYPSLMLTRELGPRTDPLGVFLKLLKTLRTFRLEAKAKMQASPEESEKIHLDALQTTFKVLINSFYGYLGFAQGHFNDFASAEKVTEAGRTLLKAMITALKDRGALPVEIDTDGIYFVPPSSAGRTGSRELEKFRQDFAATLPEGIEIEFDGEYRAMYSYKMKNYALLENNGEIVIKGAALKSRGLEPFQRSFLRDLIRLRLEGKEAGIPDLKKRYEDAIRNREWPIEQFTKTEMLQDAPSTYAAKVEGKKRARSAVYELVQRAERDYRAGDHVSYYVTGAKKSVAVHENSKLVTDWDPKSRDENVAYYLAKLDALYEKFGAADSQGELGL